MVKRGLFITLEGGEGGGKTTQINWLAEALTAKKHKVVTTREPGGTPEGEKIRNLLVQREGGNWTPVAECLMLFAARAMHVNKIIRPALDEERIVISDRFTDSTRAYQGYGMGVDLKKIDELNRIVLDGFTPDLTFILDIDPREGLLRSGRRLASEELKINQSEDRYENLDLSFHEKLRAGFLDIAKKEPERCHVIDASQSADTVEAQIFEIVQDRLAAHARKEGA